MKNLCLSFALLFLFPETVFSQHLYAYKVYKSDGKPSSYTEMIETAGKREVVFFGEHHGVYLCHWIEKNIAADLYEKWKKKTVIGAEMFERDDQLVINEYIAGTIPERHFEKSAALWPGHRDRYRPLVQFARQKGISFAATNVPRRYANLVFRKGMKALVTLDGAAGYLPPLPIPFDRTLRSYRKILKAAGRGNHHMKGSSLAMAQALKDASMAQVIAGHVKNGKRVFHVNGAYHSDYHEGIVWYLKKYSPGTSYLTISTVRVLPGEKPSAEDFGRGDFLLAVPSSWYNR